VDEFETGGFQTLDQFHALWRSRKIGTIQDFYGEYFAVRDASGQNAFGERLVQRSLHAFCLLHLELPGSFKRYTGYLFLLFGLFSSQRHFPREVIQLSPENVSSISKMVKESDVMGNSEIRNVVHTLLLNTAFLVRVSTMSETIREQIQSIGTSSDLMVVLNLNGASESFNCEKITKLQQIHVEFSKQPLPKTPQKFETTFFKK